MLEKLIRLRANKEDGEEAAFLALPPQRHQPRSRRQRARDHHGVIIAVT